MSAKQRKKDLFSVFFVACLDNFGFGIVFILFAPLMLNPSYGMLSPDATVGTRNLSLGLLFLSFPLTQFFGAPLFGDIADRFGRKFAFYLTIIGITFGYLLSGIAIAFHSFTWLLISRLISGLCAGNLSICLATIADLSPNEKARARNFGFVTVVWGISWPVAMIVGGYLSDPKISPYFNPALPFYLTAFLSLISLILIGKFFKETHEREPGLKLDLIKGIHNILEALAIVKMRRYFLIILFWTLGWGLSVQWFGVFSIEKFQSTQEAISWGLIAQGVLWTLGGSILNPLLLKRYSTKITCLVGLAQAILFILIATLSNKFVLFGLLYSFAAIGSSFALSNSLNLLSVSAPKNIQGKAMGLSQSMMALGWFLVPIAGGLLGNLDINLFYPIAALFLALAFLLLLTKKRSLSAGDRKHGVSLH